MHITRGYQEIFTQTAQRGLSNTFSETNPNEEAVPSSTFRVFFVALFNALLSPSLECPSE